MDADFDALHQQVRDYFGARGLPWGQTGSGARPALVIIDMAYGWTDPQYPGGSLRMSRAVDSIARLLEDARPLGAPVIYTTSPRPYGLWYDADLPEAEKAALAEAHRRTKIDERINPRPEDYVIYKSGASAFLNTDLFRYLKTLDIDTLLVTGCVTSCCVRASVMDASNLGLKPILVRECVDDRSEVEHEWHIRDLSRFCEVWSLEETVAYLQRVLCHTSGNQLPQ